MPQSIHKEWRVENPYLPVGDDHNWRKTQRQAMFFSQKRSFFYLWVTVAKRNTSTSTLAVSHRAPFCLLQWFRNKTKKPKNEKHPILLGPHSPRIRATLSYRETTMYHPGGAGLSSQKGCQQTWS